MKSVLKMRQWVPSQNLAYIHQLQNDITLNITILEFVLKILFHWQLSSQRKTTSCCIFTKNTNVQITSFIAQSVLRKVQSFFQSDCNRVLPFQVPVSSAFPKDIKWLLTSSFLYPRLCYFTSIFPSIVCFRTQFLHKM